MPKGSRFDDFFVGVLGLVWSRDKKRMATKDFKPPMTGTIPRKSS